MALSLRWGNHEGGKHNEAENYTRQDLYRLIDQGEDVDELNPTKCGDPVLADVAFQLAASAPTILDHDAQFEHAKDDGDAPDTSDTCDTCRVPCVLDLRRARGGRAVGENRAKFH